MRRYLILIFLLFIHISLQAQTLAGIVTDAANHQPLPFATIKFGNTTKGMVTDIDGKFSLQTDDSWGYLEVSYLGYEPYKLPLPAPKNIVTIELKPNEHTLNEVVVKPPYDKIRRILNSAIANRAKNNPDKYDWYRCHVYYKMTADVTLPDSVMDKDTDKASVFARSFVDSQHIIMSETYSIRTWRKPQQLQEDILATRLSGFKNTMFTTLVTNVLPFHAYNDYLTLNGKDFHNPVSRGFSRYYEFNLDNEIEQGKDTVWVLSFRPHNNINELKGTVYINSDGYAIAYLLASGSDTSLKRTVRIEQQYQKTPDTAAHITRWFPDQLNYIIDWDRKSDSMDMHMYMKGSSVINNVSFQKAQHFHFDKLHTVRLQPSAEHATDSTWAQYRPVALDNKELRTYKVDDSLMEKAHIDKIMPYLAKLPEFKIPIGIFDFDLKRLLAVNRYESVRLGLGLQTNEKLIRWLSMGGWGGYGFGDHKLKYGAFLEAYADKYKEFTIKLEYKDDINDPGRVHLGSELDHNYLNLYLMNRVDETRTYSAMIKKKMGYWTLEAGVQQQYIIPQYAYSFIYNGEAHTTFTAREAVLNWRYAYAEQSAPFFGYYRSLGSKYPIWYGHLATGMVTDGTMQIPYTQAVSAVAWHKHINTIGNENILVEGGYTWSDDPLPLSKSFAGNGYRYDNGAIYAFGGMMTILPYQYYSDRFVNLVFRHDFDWKLYKISIPQSGLVSAPFISLGYNLLYGTLKQPDVHQGVAFSVPSNGYNEAGVILNGLLMLKYANAYYLSLNLGYYYHIDGQPLDTKNGVPVIGSSIIF